MTIKVGLFDWGEFLMNWRPLYRVTSSIIGVSETEFLKAYIPYQARFQKGELTEQELLQLMHIDQGIPRHNGPLFRPAFEKVYRPKKGTLSITQNLHDQGYKLGIVYNTEQPILDFYREQRHYGMISFTVFSPEVGFRKPEEEIFRVALQKAGVPAEEAFFVDDVQEYVDIANKLGIHGIHYKNQTKLKKDLENLLGHRI